MRCAVFSDIHGNLPALQAAIADARSRGAGEFFLLGDLLNGAPRPTQVLDLLTDLAAHSPVTAVRGNVDQYQLDLTGPNPPEDYLLAPRWATLRWTAQQTGAAASAYLRSLPQEAVLDAPGGGMRLVHASPGSLSRGLVPGEDPAVMRIFRAEKTWENPGLPPPMAEQLDGAGEGLILCGHLHVPWQVRLPDGRLVANPGSTGMSNSGDSLAHYALLDWDGKQWQAELLGAPYDTAALARDYASSGLLEAGGAFARACLGTVLSGRNVAWFLVSRALEIGGGSLPDWAFQQAAEEFDWSRYGV